MRVAELFASRRFRVVERGAEDPGPGEVQVRVKAVGVCGSDLHYFAEGGVGDQACVYPMVLGHEPTGTVVKTGPGVTGWSPGDPALLEPALYCHHCEFCLTGRRNVCQNIRFLSMPGEPGFFRDYVNLPLANLLPFPRSLSLKEATLFEPLAVILHSMKFASLGVGETAAVFGAGPIGLLTVAVLKLSGAGRVFSVDPVPHRLELARQVGADAVLDPSQTDPVAEIRRDTHGRGVDVAIDCAAKADSLNQCLYVARHAGRVVVTGIPSQSHVALDFNPMRRKELALFNVRRSNHETGLAVELLEQRRPLFTCILTHAFPLEAVERAFHTLERYEDGVGKVVIEL